MHVSNIFWIKKPHNLKLKMPLFLLLWPWIANEQDKRFTTSVDIDLIKPRIGAGAHVAFTTFKQVLNNTLGIRWAAVPGRLGQGEASLQRDATVHQQPAEQQRRMARRASRRAAGGHPWRPAGRARRLRFQLEGWAVATWRGSSLPSGLLGRLAHSALSCRLPGSETKSCLAPEIHKYIFTLPRVHAANVRECSSLSSSEDRYCWWVTLPLQRALYTQLWALAKYGQAPIPVLLAHTAGERSPC